VKDAISLLLDIGALQPGGSDEDKYEITPLGLHLVRLPVDVKLGKMLIYACLFNCVDPILTVAAALGGKSPLLHPLDNRDAALVAHARFSTHNHSSFSVPIPESPSQLSKKPYFPTSDHLTVIRIFDHWSHLRTNEGRDSAFEFCRRNFLSYAALEDICDIRMQFRLYLQQAGLITELPEDHPRTFSEDLVRCALCAGHYSPSILFAPSSLRYDRPTDVLPDPHCRSLPSSCASVHGSKVCQQERKEAEVHSENSRQLRRRGHDSPEQHPLPAIEEFAGSESGR
jgi:hypothetical protein